MPTPKRIQRYGWRRQSLDHRDTILRPATSILPPSADLTSLCPPVYDQGQAGSCTANAIAGAFDFERVKQGKNLMHPSRLFIYYNERVIEGDPNTDAGAEIRDGIKSVASQGVCPEVMWAYDINRLLDPPPPRCYNEAPVFRVLQYAAVPQDSYNIRQVLATDQRPVVFGFSVFEEFESDAVASTGTVPMPDPNSSPIGGHAVCIVGYDDHAQLYKCRNSWGESWGMSGYFTLPYAYVHDPNLASDFWVILKTGNSLPPLNHEEESTSAEQEPSPVASE